MKKLGVALVLLLAVAFGTWRLADMRTFQLFGEIVPRVETERKVVALTFDDGPTDASVDRILAAVDVPATFFVCGAEIERHPQAAAKIVSAGHELGNHSYSHPRMVFKSQAFIAKELETTDALIRRAGYRGPITFRSPYCKKLVGLPWYLRRTRRANVTWDVESEKVQEIVAQARPGSIILLHPWYGNEHVRVQLPAIIRGLKAKGFTFVTVSELLAMRKA